MKNSIKYLAAALAALCPEAALCQLSGFVRDASNGEALPGATVVYRRSAGAAVCNGYGFYSLPSPAVPDTAVVSFVGYTSLRVPIDPMLRTADYRLVPAPNTIGEVTVAARSAFAAALAEPQMAHHHLTGADIRRAAMMFGEPDVLKSLQMMPGVASAADGTTNMSIRGGSHDQNLVILDDAVIYNPSHALGLFSAFNPDAIASADLYKGALPARYGGRLSGVADIRLRDGDNQAWHTRGSLGICTSRLMVEGPIRPDTASLLVGVRVGYSGVFNKALDIMDGKMAHEGDEAHFFDVCAKANWQRDAQNRFFLSAYVGGDDFRFAFLNQGDKLKWANRTATLRWNHLFAPHIFSNTSLCFSHYDYAKEQQLPSFGFLWRAKMNHLAAKTDFEHQTPAVRLAYGGGLEYHHYRPGELDPDGTDRVRAASMGSRHQLSASLYGSAEAEPLPGLKLQLGARLSAASHVGSATIYHYADAERTVVADTAVNSGFNFLKTYGNIEPRLSASYSPAPWVALKASYDRTAQYQHLLSTSILGVPTDIWVPADSHLRPQTADAVAVGLHFVTPRYGLEISAEAYKKKFAQLIDFKDNASLLMNEHYETEIRSGRGNARGLELMLAKSAPRYAFCASYTLAEAKRQVDGANGGRWYYATFSQKHTLKVNGSFRPKPGIELAAAFSYHTGGRTTLPTKVFVMWDVDFVIYSDRNAYILPHYHRLDVSARFDLRSHGRYRHHLDFSIYNVYSRANAFSAYHNMRDSFFEYDNMWHERQQSKVYKLYLYRIVPSVAYVFEF